MSPISEAVMAQAASAQGLRRSDLILERFAQENGLDLGALTGGTVFSSGRTDVYQVKGPGSWDGAAPVLAQITALGITTPMRFGNSVIQLSNAVEFAINHSIPRIYAPGFWWIGSASGPNAGPIRVFAEPVPGHENSLEGMFYYRQSLAPLYRHPGKSIEAIRRNLGLLVGQIPIMRARDPLPDDHLVIHIRSGDVFCGEGHPLYGQPPLAFYKLILRRWPWRKATLVAEDRNNPVIDALLNASGKGLPPLHYQAASLEDDLEILLRARSLVGSLGTFIPAVLALSSNIRRVLCFDRLWYAQELARRADIIVVQDVGGGFSRRVLARNWRNSSDQRELMLSYPEDRLALRLIRRQEMPAGGLLPGVAVRPEKEG